MLLSFRLSRKRLHELLPFSFPIVFVAAGFFILNASDRYFLAHFVGMNEVAIYALGYKLTFILLHFIIIPIDLAYAPYVFDHLNDPDIKKKMAQIFTLSILLITLVGSAILFVSEDLIRLIAPADFNSSYAVTFCIMPVVAFTGILYWAAVLIHISKKTYIIGVTITVSSILNLWLNYMLIPRFGWKGAVISTNGSYLLAVIVIFCVGMHLYKVKLELKRLAIIISAVVSLFVIYYFLNQANRIIYYGGVGLSYFLIFGVFHQISFFNRAERSLISSIFNR